MKFYISNYHYINEESPDLSFLPAMARRKLTLLDKVSLAVMNKAYEAYKAFDCSEPQLVFASQYGELDRLDKIISQYLEDNEVSPAAFSASVHNSVVGQFCLLKGIKKSYNALASAENTFSAGLLESFLSVKEGNDVLYCYADAYKAVKACAMLISLNKNENSIKVSLSNVNCVGLCCDEFWAFKEFCENKKDRFTSLDNLFSLSRGNE